MQKGFLIAGGLLLLGFLGYTIFGKKEEEEIEDAEYYIVVETKQAKDDGQIQQQTKVAEASVENLPLKASNDTEVKEQVKEVPSISLDEKEITTFLKKKEVPLVNQTQEEEKLSEPQKTTPKTKDNQTAINEIQAIEAKEIKLANDEFPLTLGSVGQRVWNLKVYLLKNHGAGGIVTNVYDTLTAERVKRFLKVDQVSEQLYKKLNMESTRKKKKHATAKKKY